MGFVLRRSLIYRNILERTVFVMGKLLLLFFLLVLMSCQKTTESSTLIYDHTKELAPSEHLRAVIFNPAGSSQIMDYDSTKRRMIAKVYAHGTEQMDFLAFPGNFGKMIGTDGNMSEVYAFIPSEALLSGEIIEVNPVGTLLLENAGRPMTVVVCIPIEDKYEAPDIEDFVDLMTSYDAVKYQIQHWFDNYLGQTTVKVLGWEDEKYALQLFQKNEKKD